WGHQEGGCEGREQQHHEIEVALELRERGEPLRERDREQEREQHLDAGQGHPQLAEELIEVAADSLGFGLVAIDLNRPVAEQAHVATVARAPSAEAIPR